jgi:hypothetical protein
MRIKLLMTLGLILAVMAYAHGQSWSNTTLYKGSHLKCFADTKQDVTIDNYLRVNIGSYADAYIKIVDMATDEDIRQVYIPSRSTYEIKGIPEGKYYLKIAFGKSPQVSPDCKFRFNKDAYYKKGDDIMDFNFVREADGYSIPSFALSLDVEVTFTEGGTYDQDVITVAEFND